MTETLLEAIDIKPGMTYRRLPAHDWATVKAIKYSHGRVGITDVTIEDEEGGGCSVGAYCPLLVKIDNEEDN